MKKVLLFLTIFFAFFFSSYFESLKAKLITFPFNKINIDEKSARILLKNLNFLCLSENFFLNLKKHKTYPKFGSIKNWKNTCNKLKKSSKKNEATKFIQKNFLFKIAQTSNKGLLTGYYEPEIMISKTKRDDYIFPILKKNKTLFKERKVILREYSDNDVLYWTNSNIDLFFLQIQGSGIGVINKNKKVKLIYNGNNGYKYTSIGKILIKRKYLKRNEVSLFTIKNWLKKNPKLREEIFNLNKRYIFFKTQKYTSKFPKGAMGINLVPNLSLAIDKSLVPFGIPIYLSTEKEIYNKLVISHDTGSAIKGYNRGDLFTGRGKKAETLAGNLKIDLQLIFLLPYNKPNE